MPTFTYEAMNSVGQPVKGEVEASSSEEAIARVRSMGNFPTKIKEKSARKPQQKKSAGAQAGAAAAKRRTAGRVPRKLLTQFTRQLSTLIDAGLPILRSLRILEEQQKPGMLRVAIRMVAEDVEGGATLSEAMSRHPKAFDRLFVNMVRAGELGGVLDLILQRLADFMEKSQALKRKIVGAMIYPAAVITFAVLIVAVLLMFVVPKFQTIFADMGDELPPVTEALLGFSDWMVRIGWIWMLAFPIGLYLLIKLLRTSPGGRYFVDNVKLHIPLFGLIVSKGAVARFARTLGTLLSAGVPILEAINITRETSGNEVYVRALGKVHDGIREGESFAGPLKQAKIVDPMVVNMIDVGEETGELDKMLNKVADTYDEEVEVLVGAMTSLMEPLLIIFLGLIVGFIVIALFMPMVAMIQNMQN
ncbi:MAG: type II secretion system F family protein [Phycisphaerae bacterium]